MPSNHGSDVCTWQETDQAPCLLSSGYWGVSGLIADMLRAPSLTRFGHSRGSRIADPAACYVALGQAEE
jgi:hypothetical protein